MIQHTDLYHRICSGWYLTLVESHRFLWKIPFAILRDSYFPAIGDGEDIHDKGDEPGRTSAERFPPGASLARCGVVSLSMCQDERRPSQGLATECFWSRSTLKRIIQ
jgi:hypothetical protein